MARAAGETAPLDLYRIVHILVWDGVLNAIASMSVLIYEFALLPSDSHNQLAWAASLVLVMFILGLNLFSRWLSRVAAR